MQVGCDPQMATEAAALSRRRATSIMFTERQPSPEYNDWEIHAKDIEIVKRTDGTPWLLGQGAFGKARGFP